MTGTHSNTAAKVLLRTSLEKKWLSLGVAVSVAGTVLTALIPPLVLADIIDRLNEGKHPGILLCLAYFVLLLLSYLFESSKEGLLTVFGQKCATALRTALCDKIPRLEADNFVSQDPGVLVARFGGDVDTVESLFTSGIIGMAADAMKMLGIFAVIAVKNTGLFLIILPLVPLIFFFTRKVQKKTRRSQLENREALARESAHIPETVRSLRTVRNTGTEEYMEQKYDSFIMSSYAAIEKTNFFDAVYSPVILIINALAVATVMLLSASGNQTVLTLFGMSVGTAVAVINYISQIFGPIESIGMEIQTLQSAGAGLERINSFLSLPERNPASAAAACRDCNTAVRFENVHFSYKDGKEVLHGLSLEIKAGEKLTLAGRTGAGKSTIFRLLMGLYTPQEGSVLIFGRPATEITDAERRKLFGCVEQSFRPVPGTVLDQVSLKDPSVSRSQALAALELSGLSPVISSLEKGADTEFSHTLFSQGQEQLLSVARAVAADPEILLLDEITANLDAETEKALLAALDRAAEQRTVISISHRLYMQKGGKVFTLE